MHNVNDVYFAQKAKNNNFQAAVFPYILSDALTVPRTCKTYILVLFLWYYCILWFIENFNAPLRTNWVELKSLEQMLELKTNLRK